jgi:hypothetical protein
MRFSIFILSILLFSSCRFFEDSITVINESAGVRPTEVVDSSALKRICLITTYTNEIGVREKGNNRGERVCEYQLNCGFPNCGVAWCACFVKWCLDRCAIKNNINGWAASAHVKNRLTTEPKRGDLFTLYYQNLGRIGHTGFYDGNHNEIFYNSVEGNTSGSGTREGDGVYRMKRSYKATYSFSNWID